MRNSRVWKFSTEPKDQVRNCRSAARACFTVIARLFWSGASSAPALTASSSHRRYALPPGASLENAARIRRSASSQQPHDRVRPTGSCTASSESSTSEQNGEIRWFLGTFRAPSLRRIPDLEKECGASVNPAQVLAGLFNGSEHAEGFLKSRPLQGLAQRSRMRTWIASSCNPR